MCFNFLHEMPVPCPFLLGYGYYDTLSACDLTVCIGRPLCLLKVLLHGMFILVCCYVKLCYPV
ncbi:hypothetical protein Patl1_25845 [Pistacia atlantica]|uniref:Uncharacterized protein n=1 Tax=Pistacia atlantica TaxID=434234 RepID=A0ACC1B4J2_9ROSI|nr:hypothetical protein Patl1_25845 [Pistacia atlantica]